MREPSAPDRSVVDGPDEGPPRPPGRVRRLLRAHPQAADVALAAGLVLLAVPTWSGTGGPDRAFVHIGLFAPLAVRRRWPVAVFAVVAAVSFLQWTADLRADIGNLSLLVAMYTVATLAPRARAYQAAGVLEVGVFLAVARWGNHDGGAGPSAFVALSGMVIAALVLGLYVRNRRAHLAYLEGRAERAERERDQQARLAAAAERARIAREMHDVVAHSLSVMIALADGAAFAIGRSPRQATDAMENVSSTGRLALGEMRRLLGVLRYDDEHGEAERSPQPGLDDLDGLVEHVRGAGLPVTYQVSGRPLTVPRGAQLAVFRIVQEALTNTLKHAGTDVTAAVSLRYDPDGVEVDVFDDGRPSAPVSPFGHGLIGMRERTAVYGGTVEAGPAPGGGWRVHARVPLDQESIAG